LTEKHRRVVLDTNVLVSRLILPDSVPARVVAFVIASSELLLSAPVIQELEDVLRRPKLDRYLDANMRLNYLWELVDIASPIRVLHRVTDCRDPRDNKFLELALSGKADFIITGDKDLLSLNPWRGIAILNPTDYLARVA
jgi:putative PIN family toxin of toxin-antitoxin system